MTGTLSIGLATMDVGLQTCAFKHLTAAEAATQAAALGFRKIEFWQGHIDLFADSEPWHELTRLCADLGLTIDSNDPVAIENDVRQARHCFECAREQNFSVLNVLAPPESLPLLEGLALEYDLPVGVCNTGPETDWSDILSFDSLLRNRDRHLGLCVDCGLFLRVPEMPERVIDQFRDRIYSVYLRDYEADEEGDVGEELPLEEGTLVLSRLSHALDDARFTGPLILRYEGTQVEPAEALRRSMAKLRDLR